MGGNSIQIGRENYPIFDFTAVAGVIVVELMDFYFANLAGSGF